MDVSAFMEAAGAERVCGKAIVRQGENHVIVARLGDGGYEYTEEGKKLAEAYTKAVEAEAPKKRRAKKTEA